MTTLHPSILHINGKNLSEETVKIINKMVELAIKNKKYSWHENHEETMQYTVLHNENDVETLIALTDTSEKAHLITFACNQYDHLTAENQRLRKALEIIERQLDDRTGELESAFVLHRSLEWKLNAANKIIEELEKPVVILGEPLKGDRQGA